MNNHLLYLKEKVKKFCVLCFMCYTNIRMAQSIDRFYYLKPSYFSDILISAILASGSKIAKIR